MFITAMTCILQCHLLLTRKRMRMRLKTENITFVKIDWLFISFISVEKKKQNIFFFCSSHEKDKMLRNNLIWNQFVFSVSDDRNKEQKKKKNELIFDFIFGYCFVVHFSRKTKKYKNYRKILNWNQLNGVRKRRIFTWTFFWFSSFFL